MHDDHETRLDQNVKRVDVGALVTLANVSTNTRQHYFISPGGNTPSLSGTNQKIHIVTANDPIAKVLKGAMKGDKVFFRHNLVIEFIEWPSL